LNLESVTGIPISLYRAFIQRSLSSSLIAQRWYSRFLVNNLKRYLNSWPNFSSLPTLSILRMSSLLILLKCFDIYCSWIRINWPLPKAIK
jgi:hypothetical protein